MGAKIIEYARTAWCQYAVEHAEEEEEMEDVSPTLGTAVIEYAHAAFCQVVQDAEEEVGRSIFASAIYRECVI